MDRFGKLVKIAAILYSFDSTQKTHARTWLRDESCRASVRHANVVLSPQRVAHWYGRLSMEHQVTRSVQRGPRSLALSLALCVVVGLSGVCTAWLSHRSDPMPVFSPYVNAPFWRCKLNICRYFQLFHHMLFCSWKRIDFDMHVNEKVRACMRAHALLRRAGIGRLDGLNVARATDPELSYCGHM